MGIYIFTLLNMQTNGLLLSLGREYSPILTAEMQISSSEIQSENEDPIAASFIAS